MRNKHQFLYILSLFFVSFSVMVFEIIGVRILAPFAGSGAFVWTIIIGVILTFFSIGYYLGGLSTDDKKKISQTFLVIAMLFVALSFFHTQLLSSLYSAIDHSYLFSFISSVIIFGPLSFLLSFVSPFLSEGIISSYERLGGGIGRSYMIGSLGSIAGTFLAGFVLIPYFHISHILLFLGILFLFLFLVFARPSNFIPVTILVCIVVGYAVLGRPHTDALFEKSTPYGLVRVVEHRQGNLLGRYLYVDNLFQTELVVEDNTLILSPYAYFYDLAFVFTPVERALMIGGGGYAYPRYFLEHYPDRSLDVVEINSVLTEVAYDFFGLEPNERLKIFHDDGRIFLQKNEQKYDAIMIDAFSGYSIPEHLATQEFAQLVYERLSDQGVVVINIPGSLVGEHARFLGAEYTTYQSVFPFVDIFLVREPSQPEILQNTMLVARKSDAFIESERLKHASKIRHHVREVPEFHKSIILTDDYAPVPFMNRSFENKFQR